MKRLILAIALLGATGCTARYAKLEAAYDHQSMVIDNQANRIQKLEGTIRELQADADADRKAYEEILRDFKPLIDKGLLEVKFENNRVVVGMASDVLFPSGSAALSAQGRESVTQVGKLLARYGQRRFQIEGHTDNQPISTKEFPNNWVLGSSRAIAVVEVLVNAGMTPKQISAATFAENSPIAPNDSDAGRAKNRRIELVLLPDLKVLDYGKALEAPPPLPDRPEPPPRRRRH